MNQRTPLVLVAVLVGFASSAPAQGTAFTYQGRLTDNGGPANGLYDLNFSVFDAETAGTQVGGTIVGANTSVSNGLLTVTLDFGSGIFDGPSRWLELGVRTNGAASFTALGARQALTATPYAIFASQAATAGAVNWNSVSGVPLLITSNSISTIGQNALTLQINGVSGLRLEPDPRGAGVPNVIGGWAGNSIGTNNSGGSVIVGGGYAGIPNTIQEFSYGDFIGAGSLNQIRSNANDAVITGGFGNTVGSGQSVVGGGGYNTILGDNSYDSVIGGGYGNTISNTLTGVNGVATIGGGYANYNYGWAATIAGGWNHIVTGTSDFIGGGSYNTASNNYASVVGGYGNNALGFGSSIGGGYYNRASGTASVIGGGNGNVSSNDYAVISGGIQNTAFGFLSTSVGGQGNAALVNNSTVVGGLFNTNSGVLGFIGGGDSNVVSGWAGTIAGGDANNSIGGWGTVGGGQQNSAGAAGSWSTVGGGFRNAAAGAVATVPGGQDNVAQGNTSFAAGTRAKALHDGTFVWGDLTLADFPSTAPNQFLIRAAGGVGINQNNPLATLDVNGTIRAASFSGDGSGLANVNAATFGGLGSSSFWSTTGNAGTSPGVDFIGTTDNQPLLLRGSFVGIGRANRVTGAEYFGINAPVPAGNYGGMYVNVTNATALPFYGYSLGGGAAAWHYVDGSDGNKWKLYVGGVQLTVATSGNVGIGTTSPDATLTVNGVADKPGGGAWATFSDLRLKKDIRPLEDALPRLLQLRGVSFEYKDPQAVHERPGRQTGMIAQEVEKVFPDWVDTAANGMKRVSIHGFEALTVEALRQLSEEKDAKIAKLERELSAQKELTTRLESRFTALENALAATPLKAESASAVRWIVTARKSE